MNKPPYILLEGTDGSGKTILAHKIADWLKGLGFVVTTTREPFGRETRQRIITEELTNDEALALFMRDRHIHMCEVVIPAIQVGRAVVQDRGIYSTLCYQGFLNDGDIPSIEQHCFTALGEFWPSIALWLDCPPSIAAERIGRRENRIVDADELRELETLSAAYQFYSQCDYFPQLKRIDASTPEQTLANAIAAIESTLKQTSKAK